MQILLKPAQAGTLESSDILVTVSPAPQGAGVTIHLTSPTMQQYGEHIRNLILGLLGGCGVADADVVVNDKGAVDFVIEARVRTAISRAMKAS